MNRLLAFATVLLVGCASGGPRPEAVDDTLHTVASTGLHRLLVYRVCSPEHCWSRAYLQWLDPSLGGGVIRTTEVSELGYGSFVESAQWIWSGDVARLEIVVVPSHGNSDPDTIVVSPGVPGEYIASQR